MTKSLFFLHAFSYKEKTTLQIGGLVQCGQIPLEVSSHHTSHAKVYFNGFVTNVLRNNMGMVIFDLQGYGGC